MGELRRRARPLLEFLRRATQREAKVSMGVRAFCGLDAVAGGAVVFDRQSGSLGLTVFLIVRGPITGGTVEHDSIYVRERTS